MGGLSEMLTCSSNSKGKESEPDKNREGKERGGEGRRREKLRQGEDTGLHSLKLLSETEVAAVVEGS